MSLIFCLNRSLLRDRLGRFQTSVFHLRHVCGIHRTSGFHTSGDMQGTGYCFFLSFCSADTLQHLVKFEVNLLQTLVKPWLWAWDSGVPSWDRLGKAGGPLYVAVCHYGGCMCEVPRLAVPSGKWIRSQVVALLILWVEVTGVLWSGIAPFPLPFWITVCNSSLTANKSFCQMLCCYWGQKGSSCS